MRRKRKAGVGGCPLGGEDPPWSDLAAGYAAMAADEEREREAHEWAEGLVGDAWAEEERREEPSAARAAPR